PGVRRRGALGARRHGGGGEGGARRLVAGQGGDGLRGGPPGPPPPLVLPPRGRGGPPPHGPGGGGARARGAVARPAPGRRTRMGDPPAARWRRWIGWGLALVAAAAVALVAWSVWDREAMAAWKRQLAPFPFFVAMTVLPAFGLPLTPFLVLAGATFGMRV